MNNNCYILDNSGRPVREPDSLKWAEWFGFANRTVGDTTVGASRISTVFLGIDHNYSGNGRPVLWETLVFGGELDQHQERCSGGSEEAEAMHKRVVAEIEAGVDCPACRGMGETPAPFGSVLPMLHCDNCGGTGKLKATKQPATTPTMDLDASLAAYRQRCIESLGFRAHDPEEVTRWCFHNRPEGLP